MELNDNAKNMIRALTDNDAQRAKQYAKTILANDRTKANRSFCAQNLAKLENPAISGGVYCFVLGFFSINLSAPCGQFIRLSFLYFTGLAALRGDLL